jgi:uncharacterized membrane protein
VAIAPPIVTQNMLDWEDFRPAASVSVEYQEAVMRIIVVAAIFAVSFALTGCFHFHQSQVYTAPQALPPLK